MLDRLAGTAHGRLSALATAAALGLAVASLPGAIEQLRKLVNVEGYPVISREPATGEVILDLDLAAEQFQVLP